MISHSEEKLLLSIYQLIIGDLLSTLLDNNQCIVIKHFKEETDGYRYDIFLKRGDELSILIPGYFVSENLFRIYVNKLASKEYTDYYEMEKKCEEFLERLQKIAFRENGVNHDYLLRHIDNINYYRNLIIDSLGTPNRNKKKSKNLNSYLKKLLTEMSNAQSYLYSLDSFWDEADDYYTGMG